MLQRGNFHMVCIPTLEHGNEKYNFILKSVNYFWPLMKDAKFCYIFFKRIVLSIIILWYLFHKLMVSFS